ncbi:MAG: hypothetical protein ACP5N3_01195 [Candidatus Nanoarchaeia archaeon]
MENLKKKILEKKELKGLNEEFLDAFIDNYKKKHPREFSVLEQKQFNEKSKEFDFLKKYLRKKLREVHGVFARNQLSEQKKKLLLKKLEKTRGDEEEKITKKILESHQSTSERLPRYEELYSRLFENNKPQKIIDLGCGYNPFSYLYILKTGVNPEYVATDINKQDIEFIEKYFFIKKIKGRAFVLDLALDVNLKKIERESQNSDFCFLFKLLDSLESKRKGSSEKLLNHLNSKELVISFPLKTIGGKGKIKGKRKWFEKILKNDKYLCSEFETSNEKYYILKPKKDRQP